MLAMSASIKLFEGLVKFVLIRLVRIMIAMNGTRARCMQEWRSRTVTINGNLCKGIPCLDMRLIVIPPFFSTLAKTFDLLTI